MIEPNHFLGLLATHGITNFYGVPDSLLKDFCAYIDDTGPDGSHIIAANEGGAVALACGYHLATGNVAAVYLQNSGLGNIINPITSIADSEVYKIPMLLILGWRGEPNLKDEPQHVKQGRVTIEQLELLGIPHRIVEASSNAEEVIGWAADELKKCGSPVALVVRNGTFAPYKRQRKNKFDAIMTREDALRRLLRLAGDSPVISTTGKTSREVYEIRAREGQDQRDFLTVGGMGHTASIALGVALATPKKRIVCLDGDGSVLMHMGTLPIIGSMSPNNLVHVLLNNAAHESVGGQPTVGDRVDFRSVAIGSGYSAYERAYTHKEIDAAWDRLERLRGPVLLEIVISCGSRSDLGRPTSTPVENKQAFMSWVKK